LNPGGDSQRAARMRVWRMRTGISITLKPADRRRLKVLTRDRNTPHKHVWLHRVYFGLARSDRQQSAARSVAFAKSQLVIT
jgi:hypothetical protein